MSVRMEQITSHGTDVDETCYLIFVRIVVGKIKVLLKSDKNNGYFTWRRFDICDSISRNSSLNDKYLRWSCRENQNTFYIQDRFFENFAVYDVMSKEMVEPEGPQMT
jgi:hypothetical protein